MPIDPHTLHHFCNLSIIVILQAKHKIACHLRYIKEGMEFMQRKSLLKPSSIPWSLFFTKRHMHVWPQKKTLFWRKKIRTGRDTQHSHHDMCIASIYAMMTAKKSSRAGLMFHGTDFTEGRFTLSYNTHTLSHSYTHMKIKISHCTKHSFNLTHNAFSSYYHTSFD